MLHLFPHPARACCSFALVMLVTLAHGRAGATEMVLHRFRGIHDGFLPSSELILDRKGNLYGTTQFGGNYGSCPPIGCGAVFEVAPGGRERLLHAFAGGSDGGFPFGGLLADASGNLYGTTSGYYGSVGTVFKLAPDGTNRVLYTFKDHSKGWIPFSELIADQNGNLYGTTYVGGDMSCGNYGCGTVFRVTPNGKETVLHAFHGAPDGAYLLEGLVRDGKGNLYGVTYSGGTGTNCSIDMFGCGTVFQIAPDGTESVLYNFQGGSDGAGPRDTLLMDTSGNLYGTTEYGGNCGQNNLCGTVFELAPDGTETVLYRFQGNNDGANPYGGVVMDAGGNLYGTTAIGGGGCQVNYGCGTVFRLAPDGTETVLQSFLLKSGGQAPEASLVEGKNGNLYGTTVAGGRYNKGVVFSVTPN